MVKVCIFLVFVAVSLQATAQSTTAEYIREYKDIAIAEKLRTGIPASITLAQGIIESRSGTSILARKSNNHFGIKAGGSWNGKTVRHNDDAPSELFRAYEHTVESYYDHSDFLMTRERYAFLFELKCCDYRAWAIGLQKAGYATSKTYAQKLIRCIEKYNLQKYDYEAHEQ